MAYNGRELKSHLQVTPLRLARINACLSQQEMAKACGVSQQSYSRHELGIGKPQRMRTIWKYSEILDVEPHYLFPELFKERIEN